MLAVVARWLGVVACLVVLGIAACDPGEIDVHASDHGSSAGTSSGSPATSGPTDTGADAVCGNGVVEADEHCDGMELSGATCASLGHGTGTLACTADCTFDKTGCTELPRAPVLMLGFSPIKQFDFSWAAVDGAEHYRLEQSVAPGEPFVQLGGDIVGTSVSFTMPLHLRHQASHRLQACNGSGCTASAEVQVMSSLAEAVGYVKASNTGASDQLGWYVVLSGDGNTLAVSAFEEDGDAIGIDGDEASDAAPQSGAVYVFVRDVMGQWSQQAYVKASNTDAGDGFGHGIALSDDGTTLAVGAFREASNATGVDGDQASDAAGWSGAVYVFVRDVAGQWSQQAYVKASNTGANDAFGLSVALSGDGDTLAVGATGEASSATGIDGDQGDDGQEASGAVYVFARDVAGQWSQQAYVKASNTGYGDRFGNGVALSGSGDVLAVGAMYENSNATGIDGDQANDAAPLSGAVYVFVRDSLDEWSQQAYVKASNTDATDAFGTTLAISDDGNTLVVGAPWEDSNATGIDGDQADDSAVDSGAIYVFVRDGMGAWSQQSYVKASNTAAYDGFSGVALADDGNVLAVAASGEDGNAAGIDGDQADDAAPSAGAVYVFVRDGVGVWSQQAYVKASNPGTNDGFADVALSGNGNTLAVGAPGEASDATGIGGDQANETAPAAGAVYIY